MMSILKKLVRSAGPLLTLGFVFAPPLLAQEQASFGWRGLLHDSAGAPIADAKVKLTGAATAEANTGTDGSFTLSALRGGQYRLAIVAEGKTAAYAQAITLACRCSACCDHVVEPRRNHRGGAAGHRCNGR